MKRRNQKVKKFELLISTSTYESQLHITDIYLYFILKYGGWSIHYCQRYSIYLRCYNIWISFYRRYNNVTGLSASLRALDFILFEISIVCIYLTRHFWVYDYNSFRFFLHLSEYPLDCIQATYCLLYTSDAADE